MRRPCALVLLGLALALVATSARAASLVVEEEEEAVEAFELGGDVGARELASRDSDRDGVPDFRDACPKSSGRSRAVDRIGCERKQIDIDFDGVCNANRPRLKSSGAYALTKWCRGLDNCKHVKNALQIDGDGDKKGDGCDLGTLVCPWARVACLTRFVHCSHALRWGPFPLFVVATG